MSYSLFDKDEHWHKPEQAFLTDDHRAILRFAVEALMLRLSFFSVPQKLSIGALS